MLWKCDLCKIQLEVPDGHVVRCQHSAVETPAPPTPTRICIHYDTSVKPMRLECGCGFVTRCKLLNKLCSYSSAVVDEFVFAKDVPDNLISIRDARTRRDGDVQLTSDNFQQCLTCAHRDEQNNFGEGLNIY